MHCKEKLVKIYLNGLQLIMEAGARLKKSNMKKNYNVK